MMGLYGSYSPWKNALGIPGSCMLEEYGCRCCTQRYIWYIKSMSLGIYHLLYYWTPPCACVNRLWYKSTWIYRLEPLGVSPLIGWKQIKENSSAPDPFDAVIKLVEQNKEVWLLFLFALRPHSCCSRTFSRSVQLEKPISTVFYFSSSSSSCFVLDKTSELRRPNNETHTKHMSITKYANCTIKPHIGGMARVDMKVELIARGPSNKYVNIWKAKHRTDLFNW